MPAVKRPPKEPDRVYPLVKNHEYACVYTVEQFGKLCGSRRHGDAVRNRYGDLKEAAGQKSAMGKATVSLLDAFNDPAADIDHNGLISTTGLTNYLTKRVPELTDGHQTPGMEVRFETTLFASGS